MEKGKIAKLKEEYDELDSKISKLFAFMKTEEFKKLTKCEKEMLLCQVHTMNTYAVILGDRICYYEGKPMIYEWGVGDDNEDIS